MPQVLNKVYKYLSNGNKKKAKKGKRKKKPRSSGGESPVSVDTRTPKGGSGRSKDKVNARTVARTPHASAHTLQKGATHPVAKPQRGANESPLLPPQSPEHAGRLTVVLDMDETLLHSDFLNIDDDAYRQEEERLTDRTVEPDYIISLVCEEIEGEVAIRKRPYLDEFIEQASQAYELVIFTAGHEEYASRVLDVVDHKGKIKYRLFRQATVTHRGQSFVKDLSRLGRDMRRIVLLDNNFLAMLASPDNSIPIFDFYGDPRDEELKSTLILLRYLVKMDDVRPFLRKTFQVRKKFDELEDLLEQEEPYMDEYKE